MTGDEKAASRYFAGILRHELGGSPDLPAPDDPGTKVVVLALPRDSRSSGASIDRFLAAGSSSSAPVDLLFIGPPAAVRDDAGGRLYRLFFRSRDAAEPSPQTAERLSAATDECVAAYSARGGVNARRLET
jgi:hypothetical protein